MLSLVNIFVAKFMQLGVESKRDGCFLGWIGNKYALGFHLFFDNLRTPNPQNRSDVLHHHGSLVIYSIGLFGGYKEETPGNKDRVWAAPWFRTIPINFEHKITKLGKFCLTLVLTVKTRD